MTRRKHSRQSVGAIFAIPLLLAVATMIGLGAGLLGDGVHDLVAALGLGLPVACIGACLLRAR